MWKNVLLCSRGSVDILRGWIQSVAGYQTCYIQIVEGEVWACWASTFAVKHEYNVYNVGLQLLIIFLFQNDLTVLFFD